MKFKRLLKLSHYLLVFSLCAQSLLATEVAYQAPAVSATSAILMDVKSKTILYQKNAEDRHYPASITKLMTALLTIENLKPTDRVTFSKEAIYGIERGSSHIALDVGEEITVDQALHGLLLESANEVANGLAEATSGSIENFAVRMTERAKELGAKNTNFMNPHGLDNENHYTTAYDMALISSYLMTNSYFLEIMSHKTYQIPYTNKTNEVRYFSQQHGLMNEKRNSRLYRPDVIGGKTGYTDIARHTLVTMAKKGEVELVVVILKADDKEMMYADTNALLDYGFNAYRTLSLHSPQTTLKTLPLYSIRSGELYQAGNVSIGTQNPLSILMRKDIKERDITTQMKLPDYLTLGITKGSTIGEITYLYKSEILAKNTLVIQDISYLPSPYITVSPTPESLFPISYKILFAIIITIVGSLFLLLSFKWKRKRHRQKVKINLDKLLK
ncbi:hypothetical protein CS063_05485 [Sporanaerobium hydrogeniformans]|uniref:Uncharacterized protein n=1 Tax=Sporanaerobium hydrogeniformans TaxID=3072179 RepID=A0AC61DE79_9FIRM|nr:D-alanyl-D-alanine carboxypeptidase family protein [Sporanaerobium hydrogeniformans]PHV71499.1 hypothetical protein CS063_05485 [Sporanaerobium hydrogeniformans]